MACPELVSGALLAKYSHEALEILREYGFIERVVVALLVPSEMHSPVDVVDRLYKILEELDAKTL